MIIPAPRPSLSNPPFPKYYTSIAHNASSPPHRQKYILKESYGRYPMLCQGPKCSGFQAQHRKTCTFKLIVSQPNNKNLYLIISPFFHRGLRDLSLNVFIICCKASRLQLVLLRLWEFSEIMERSFGLKPIEDGMERRSRASYWEFFLFLFFLDGWNIAVML